MSSGTTTPPAPTGHPAGSPDVRNPRLLLAAVAAAEDVAPFPQGYVDQRRFAATWNGASA